MVDSHIRLPTASLYGQCPFGSPSSLGPSSTPGVAGMSGEEFTPKRFSMLSTKAFCVISSVPNSQLRLKAQPVYEVNSSRLLVGNLVFHAACKSLHASPDPSITMSSARTAIISSTLPSTTMRKMKGSVLLCPMPNSTTVSASSPARCRPPYFRPYSHLLRRTVFPDMSPHPSGSFTYISALSFARTKACATPK